MPRKTRRQLVGKEKDVDAQEREQALKRLERELHSSGTQNQDHSSHDNC